MSFVHRRWKGRWIVGISILHVIVGLGFATETLAGMAGRGWFGSLEGVRDAFTVWFLAMAPALFAIGILTDRIEADGAPVPLAASLALLAMLVFILSLQPANGGWLILPAALAMLLSRKPTA